MFDAAVDAAVAVIREVRPQVVVTYDDRGDYGHPDHVMAHRVATAAVAAAADAGTAPASRGRWRSSTGRRRRRPLLREEFRGAGRTRRPALRCRRPSTSCPSASPDECVTTVVDGTACVDGQDAPPWPRTRTQVAVVRRRSTRCPTCSAARSTRCEYFRLVRGEPGPERDADGRETDLFAGVELTGSARRAGRDDRTRTGRRVCRGSGCGLLALVGRAVRAARGLARAVLRRVHARPGRGAAGRADATSLLPRWPATWCPRRRPPPCPCSPGWSWSSASACVARPEGDVILPGGSLQWVDLRGRAGRRARAAP